MIIPLAALPSDTVDAIVQEYVNREGTDYGLTEVSAEVKYAQVRQQIEQGKVVIVYSEVHQNVSLMLKENFTGAKLANR